MVREEMCCGRTSYRSTCLTPLFSCDKGIKTLTYLFSIANYPSYRGEQAHFTIIPSASVGIQGLITKKKRKKRIEENERNLGTIS